MKVAEIVPYILAVGGSGTIAAVAVLCPEVSLSLALGVSISVYVSMVLSLPSSLTFGLLTPVVTLLSTFLSFTTHFSSLIYFLSVSMIWSQVLLSLLDIQAVLYNSTGFFFSAYKAAMTLSTSTPLHHAPPAPLAALHWTFAMIFVAVVFLYREKKLSAALFNVRAVFSGGYSAIPPADPNSTSASSKKLLRT